MLPPRQTKIRQASGAEPWQDESKVGAYPILFRCGDFVTAGDKAGAQRAGHRLASIALHRPFPASSRQHPLLDFAAVHESGYGPFQPRRLSACVSAIGGLAAARGVLSARQLMTQSCLCGKAPANLIRLLTDNRRPSAVEKPPPPEWWHAACKSRRNSSIPLAFLLRTDACHGFFVRLRKSSLCRTEHRR